MKNIKQEVLKALAGMHNDDFLRCRVDEQCQQCFKLSWQEVKDVMYAKLTKGYEIMPGLSTSAVDLIEGLMMNTTGHWMTNQYLEVIYLSFSNFYSAEFHLQKFAEGKDGDYLHLKRFRLLMIAPLVCPDVVTGILNSHGLQPADEIINNKINGR
ncbi:MAG: hypothetical protein WC120_05160 [Parcubacteria group bacterium]